MAGLASNKKQKVVEVPAGSIYVLTLESPIAVGGVPKTIAQSTFQFKTEQEYSDGLEQLLQAYQRGEATAAQVLDRVRAANLYATTQLPSPLYPPVAQRQFLRQLVGFEYAIDGAS